MHIYIPIHIHTLLVILVEGGGDEGGRDAFLLA